MMFHLFTVMNIESPSNSDYLYGIFIIVHIFSFTATLDYSRYCLAAELLKIIIGFTLLYQQNKVWFNMGEIFSLGIILYFIISFILTVRFYSKHLNAPISI